MCLVEALTSPVSWDYMAMGGERTKTLQAVVQRALMALMEQVSNTEQWTSGCEGGLLSPDEWLDSSVLPSVCMFKVNLLEEALKTKQKVNFSL